MNKKIQHQLTIPAEYRGSRFDQAIARLLPDYSRALLQKWIKSGEIRLNQTIVKAKTLLQGEESVEVNAELTLKETAAAQDLPLPIVYEDEALLIVNKPVGLVVHPGAGNSDKTLMNALLHHRPDLALLPRAGIIHRLDMNTSGLLVVAKTVEAYTDLNRQLKARSIQREYQAIAAGIIISGATINQPIERHPIQRKRMCVSETGREAITHYRVLERFTAHTLLKVKLETGRTHQIRVHLAYIHHPIIGDAVYGGRLKLPAGASAELISALRNFKRQALHAYRLGLKHPISGEDKLWEIPLPADMQSLLTCLRAQHTR